jgi:hypothetical protein
MPWAVQLKERQHTKDEGLSTIVALQEIGKRRKPGSPVLPLTAPWESIAES